MELCCPYCDHRMRPKNAAPGDYHPRCTRCGLKFALRVPRKEDDPLQIQAISQDQAKPKPGTPAEERFVNWQRGSNPVPEHIFPASEEGLRSSATPAASSGRTPAPQSGTSFLPEASQAASPAGQPPRSQQASASSAAERGHRDRLPDQEDAGADATFCAMFDAIEAEQTGANRAGSNDKPGLGHDAPIDQRKTPSPSQATMAAGGQPRSARRQPNKQPVADRRTDAAESTSLPDAPSGQRRVPSQGRRPGPTGRKGAQHGTPGSGTAAASGSASPPNASGEPRAYDSARGNDQDGGTLLHVDAMEEARLAAAAAKRSQHEIAPGQTKTQRAGSDQTDQGTQVAVGSAATSAATETDRLLHHVLNGYRLDKELGRGAMGAVYLARQLSLDRNVALKIIQARWAADPSFIARFTREAYAAAQLTHHNVVQVYDLGEDHDTNFFSMEFVNGQNLGEIIKQRGKIPPKEAVGYILQAARGLAFAHAHGLIHRDIKPDNLMLNGQGLVKVADLGLVKHIGAADEEAHLPADSKLLAASKAGATVASAAMGTPAYMPPEQAEDAASVDQRADIYALGCTLYALLTGRPPFQGTTAAEVLTKHKNEPIERPDAVVTGIASELADINLRMMAKRPEDRYSSMEQVVAALQAFLERSSTSGRIPNEEHFRVLKQGAEQYNAQPRAKLRNWIPLLGGGLGVLLVLGGLLSGRFLFAGGTIAMSAGAVAGYFVTAGLRERGYLFSQVRELIFSSSRSDWTISMVTGLVLLVLLWLIGLLPVALLCAAVGSALGIGYYFAIDRPLAVARQPARESFEEMFKTLRLHGLDEAALQEFVVEYAGNDWEELFEDLFGYEAKSRARERLDSTGKDRQRRQFRAWRDPIVRRINHRLATARQRREKKHLEKVETKQLQAEGIDASQARREAERRAAAMVDQAAEIRAVAAEAASGKLTADSAAQKRARIKAMLADARGGKFTPDDKRDRRTMPLLGLLAGLVGSRMRFYAGGALLIICTLWMQQNNMIEPLREAIATRDFDPRVLRIPAGSQPQQVPLPLPGSVLVWLSGLQVGAAGLILIISSWLEGRRMGLFALPAAALPVFGAALGIPPVAGMSAHLVSACAGVGLLLVGWVMADRI